MTCLHRWIICATFNYVNSAEGKVNWLKEISGSVAPRSQTSKGNVWALWWKCRIVTLLLYQWLGGGNSGAPHPAPMRTCRPDENGQRFWGRLTGGCLPSSHFKLYKKLQSMLNLWFLIWFLHTMIKLLNAGNGQKQCQMFQSACIPKNRHTTIT